VSLNKDLKPTFFIQNIAFISSRPHSSFTKETPTDNYSPEKQKQLRSLSSARYVAKLKRISNISNEELDNNIPITEEVK